MPLTHYQRVIPRDLFNEAKLLKCWGHIALLILDEVGVPRGLTIEHNLDQDPEEEAFGFPIMQRDEDGTLHVTNLDLFVNGLPMHVEHPYNSKDDLPLRWVDETTGDSGPILTRHPDGSVHFSGEFFRYVEGLGDYVEVVS